jgi:hypothetical protein
MRTGIISFLIASLIVCGCNNETAQERLNAAKLRVYTNIPPGTLVFVKMPVPIADHTAIDTSGQPRKFDFIFTNEYIFEGIDYSSVGLREINSTNTIYFSGGMIVSITPLKK